MLNCINLLTWAGNEAHTVILSAYVHKSQILGSCLSAILLCRSDYNCVHSGVAIFLMLPQRLEFPELVCLFLNICSEEKDQFWTKYLLRCTKVPYKIWWSTIWCSIMSVQMLVLEQASQYHCGKCHDQFNYLSHNLFSWTRSSFHYQASWKHQEGFPVPLTKQQAWSVCGVRTSWSCNVTYLIWPGLYVSKAEVALIFIDHSRLSLALFSTVICFSGFFLRQGGLI